MSINKYNKLAFLYEMISIIPFSMQSKSCKEWLKKKWYAKFTLTHEHFCFTNQATITFSLRTFAYLLRFYVFAFNLIENANWPH